MAANSSSRGITALGKRVANRIWTSKSPSPPSTSRKSGGRAAYSSSSSSVYDKNPDDHIHSAPLPDDVNHATQSGKYWAPHPQTGVFGPPGGDHLASPPTSTGGGEHPFHSDVLEEKAWFRPTSLEDLEKPHSLP